MKTGRGYVCYLFVLVTELGLLLNPLAHCQVFTTLHSFQGLDGANPVATLLVSSNVLYGTTVYGGSTANGVVFSMKTNGTDFQVLHSFAGAADGAQPYSGLLLNSNTLYGSASSRGAFGNGVLFSLATDGSRFTVLHTFTAEIPQNQKLPTNVDGSLPFGPVILWSNILYGTATYGGSAGEGTVFALNPDGSDFRTLHSFVQSSDSEGPGGALIPIGGKLYGAAEGLDLSPSGGVFSINPDGTGFAVLHRFPGNNTFLFGLRFTNNFFYGVTDALRTGNVFKLDLAGGFTNLHTFSFSHASVVTNYDGNGPPRGPLAFGTNILYGANTIGGVSASGTIYSIKPDGTDFTVLYSFTGGDDGAYPSASVTLSGNTLYGTTRQGGKSGKGTIFSIELIPIPLPVITSQPASQKNLVGTTASFSVAASGQAPLSYQWLKSTNLLPQQISSKLVLTNLSDTDAGTYSVIVSNGGGAVVSAPAYLAVLDPPKIFTQPLSRTNIAGSTASFSVIASGTAPLSYQWLKGSAPLLRQTNSTLNLTNVSDADAATYSVTITNSVGKLTSGPTTLIVLDPPRMTLQPISQTNLAGTTAHFSASAAGTPLLSYQWFKGNTPLLQQRSPTLTLAKVSDADSGTYKVVITNIVGSVTSVPASLSVIDLPELSFGRAETEAILLWPTGLIGYKLQWATNISSPAWTTATNAPVIVNGQNTVTNPISGTQQFYRLSR